MPLILGVFLYIVFSNLSGLIPYTLTIFSHFSSALSISTFIYASIILGYMHKDRLKVFNLFVPSKVPLFIFPLLVPIEFISFFSRIVSLSVRLFANLTSGHILLKILSMFFLKMFWVLNTVIGLFSLPLLVATVCVITTLEGFICTLQGYVYTLLVVMYIHELEPGSVAHGATEPGLASQEPTNKNLAREITKKFLSIKPKWLQPVILGIIFGVITVIIYTKLLTTPFVLVILRKHFSNNAKVFPYLVAGVGVLIDGLVLASLITITIYATFISVAVLRG
jgi:ATP synthase subunit 6